MTYQDTIQFLFEQLPVYQKYGEKAIKKDLTNIRLLCEELGSPQICYPSIHVAGTNGKGTVTHMIASILQESGLKVGIYTSPHYVDFRERIKINGEWVSEHFVTGFVKDNLSLINELKPSFFEITVAMAFQYFKEQNVDYVVIETGLGGRLDSTNILSPKLSVITNISLDHTNILGNNIYEIANEKAGIIKTNVPVVVGRYQVECDSVFFTAARSHGSIISFASLSYLNQEFSELLLESVAPFFSENAQTAIVAINVLVAEKQLSVNQKSIKRGIENFKVNTAYQGRWQIIEKNPLVICDSAHNRDAMNKVVRHIHLMRFNNLHMIIGFVKEKDVDSILRLLPKEATYYFVQPTIFRGLDRDLLKDKSNKLGLNGKAYPNIASAYYAAKSIADNEDLIYVGGSSFVVGDFLSEKV